MTPQKQINRHRPQEGIYGDCHRTALAVVLDMDARDVPHFMDGNLYPDAEEAHDKIEEWLNTRGITTINVLYPGETSLDDVLSTIKCSNHRSKPVFILGGRSRNGVNHSVVCWQGEIACDPSHDDSGIVGPCDDGFYWVTFFGHIQGTHTGLGRGKPVKTCQRPEGE